MSNSITDCSYEHVEAPVMNSDLQPLKSTSVTNAAMERLLLEAQKDSNKSSRISSVVGSPKMETGTASPALSNDLTQQDCQDMEWVWNWSSRPEAQPMRKQLQDGVMECKSRMAGRVQCHHHDRAAFKHPANRRRPLSIRNTKLMTKISTMMEFFPYIVISHACSFIFGASLMALFLKKVEKTPAVLPIS